MLNIEPQRGFRPTTRLRLVILAGLALLFCGCTAQRQQPDSRPVVAEPAPMATATVTSPEPTPLPQPVAVPDEPQTGPDLADEVFTLLEQDPELAELTRSPLDELAEVTPEPVEPTVEPLALETAAPVQFDIPIERNQQVEYWLDYYGNRHARSFRPGLIRSGKYLPMFRQIFAEAGLPQDLVYMAHVESAYKVTAYSRARAKGVFQFIAATGKRYGLRIDYWVDERSDPEKAARAATRYLTDLYEEFGDWYLAMAAYNAGEGKIRRALRNSGKKDFWGIAKTRHIRRETKNYVPAIIAATLISKQPEKYGFIFEPDELIVYDSIEVEGAADMRVLAECAGSDYETIRALNPALHRQQTPPNATTTVRVPQGAGRRAMAALANVPQEDRVLYARHKVRGGDTLYDLARAYRVTVGAIQQTNRLGRRTIIRPGQVLVIPTAAAGNYSPLGASSDVASGSPLTYRVRRGDTLYGIARRYRTNAASVAAASGVSVNKVLQIGQRLTVVPGVRSAQTARNIARGETAGKVDGPRIHTVRRGENLWRIAKRYRTSVDALCAMNSISRNTTLHPGRRLTVAAN